MNPNNKCRNYSVFVQNYEQMVVVVELYKNLTGFPMGRSLEANYNNLSYPLYVGLNKYEEITFVKSKDLLYDHEKVLDFCQLDKLIGSKSSTLDLENGGVAVITKDEATLKMPDGEVMAILTKKTAEAIVQKMRDLS